MNSNVLLVPGIWNAVPEHWLSLWETENSNFARVQQQDWNNPVCSVWCTALESAVSKAGPNVVLIAHSLGCLLVAHWAAATKLPIKAAFLVSIPDPNGEIFPKEAVGFSPLPQLPLAFPSTVVMSSNDPFGSVEHAKKHALLWGSQFVEVGPLGHINASSSHGPWPEGMRLFQQLVQNV